MIGSYSLTPLREKRQRGHFYTTRFVFRYILSYIQYIFPFFFPPVVVHGGWAKYNYTARPDLFLLEKKNIICIHICMDIYTYTYIYISIYICAITDLNCDCTENRLQ